MSGVSNGPTISVQPKYTVTLTTRLGEMQLAMGVTGGPRGYSAFEVAVQNGFQGTEQEWLDSITGPKGDAGPGFPAGGQTGQVLAKLSDQDFETQWADFSVDWVNISNKPILFSGAYEDLVGVPATFAPSTHEHLIGDVAGLTAALNAKQPVGSYATAEQGAAAETALQPGAQIPWTDVTGKPSFFSGAWADLTGVPATFAPSAHQHAIGDVSGLQNALDAKQPSSVVLSNTTASFTTAQETKLGGIEAGAQANVPTNLAYDAPTRVLTSSTGDDATLPLVSSGAAGLAPASGGGTANFLRADGTWAAPPAYVEPGPTRFRAFNDFLTTQASPEWVSGAQGTGAGITQVAPPDDSGLGWLRFSTGTGGGTRTRIVSPRRDAINFAAGDAVSVFRIRTEALSDETDSYAIRTGFIDNDQGESVDGAFFRYNHSVNGGRWQAVARANSIETAVDTGVLVNANTNYTLRVSVSNGSAVYAINDTVVATITTNIPSGFGRETGFGVFMERGGPGAISKTMLVDYGMCEQILSGRS